MNWKIIIYLSILLLILLTAVWAYHSFDYGELLVFSRDSKAIETVQVDELFGTETKQTEWVEGFWLGILPGDDEASLGAVLGLLPLGSALIGIILISFFMNRRKQKQNN